MSKGIYFGQSNKDSFKKTMEYFKKELNISKRINLDKYGRAGVDALKRATPVDTGKTRDSWHYRIISKEGEISVKFYNSNINDGQNIAILLQYGHMTKDGYYIQGKDYINPALRPVFDQLGQEMWKEVTTVE